MAKIEKSLMLITHEYPPYVFSDVAAEDLWCIKIAPHNGYHKWRVRRAQHLLQHFLKTPVETAPPPMRPILLAEKYLHLANPWLLPAVVATVKNLRDKGLVWGKAGEVKPNEITMLVLCTILLDAKRRRPPSS